MSIDIILNSATDSDGEEWINEKAQHFNISIKQIIYPHIWADILKI